MTTAPALASSEAEFVRLGYSGASLHFRVQTGDLETFRACVHAIGAYNEFSPAAVSLRLGEIFGECECMEVGREGSPVIYAHLPFWSGQRADRARAACGRTPGGNRKYEESERRALASRVKTVGAALGASEIDELTVPETALGLPAGTLIAVRLWWD